MNNDSATAVLGIEIPAEKDIKGVRKKYPLHEIPVETLEALRDGSHAAYDEVYRSYHGPIMTFLNILVNSDEAEEIAQKVFIALWEKRHTIDPQKNIRGFLYRTARNYTMNLFNHKKVVDKYLQFKSADFELSESPDELVIGKEMELVIQIAVSNMPEQRQRIYRMRFEDNLSNEEIACKLGLSPETVKGHITLAKKDLEKVIHAFLLLFMLI